MTTIDAGRGLAIVLVVYLHACDWLGVAGFEMDGWIRFNQVIAALRMPLFFAVAGMLAGRWVRAGWAGLVTGKVTFLLWVYLLWQPVGTVVGLVVDQIKGDPTEPLRMLVSLALTPVRPRLELWFLWALALSFLLARLSSRLSVRTQLVGAGVVSAVGLWGLSPVTNPGWSGLMCYHVFFLVGLHHREALLAFAGRTRESLLLTVGLIVAWLAVALPTVLLGWVDWLGTGLLSRALGLAAGLAVAARLSGRRRLRQLGAQTLPIYLAHTPIIIILVRLLQVSHGGAVLNRSVLVLPVLLTVAVVPLTLLLRSVLTRTPARILYAPPRGLEARLRGMLTAEVPPQDASPGTVGETVGSVPEPVPGQRRQPAAGRDRAAAAGRRSAPGAVIDLEASARVGGSTWRRGPGRHVAHPSGPAVVTPSEAWRTIPQAEVPTAWGGTDGRSG